MLIYFMGGLLFSGVILLGYYNAIKTNPKKAKLAVNVFKIGVILTSMSATYLILSLFT